MQTPIKMTPDEANMVKDRWLREQVKEGLGGEPTCMRCGGGIKAITAYISVHFQEFEELCAGGGEVQQVRVPYCPVCETPPQTYGCIHIPMM